MSTEPTTVNDELTAMRRIVGALSGLDRDAQDRIAGWIYDRFRKPAGDTDGDQA